MKGMMMEEGALVYQQRLRSDERNGDKHRRVNGADDEGIDFLKEERTVYGSKTNVMSRAGLLSGSIYADMASHSTPSKVGTVLRYWISAVAS